MADKKVSDLPSLNGADVDPADLLYIVDSSAGAAGSKKITVGQYQLAPVSGGTANGVVYLDGSKVESSSSALTFDGTNLGIGTSSPAQRLDVTGAVNSVQARFGNVAGRGLEIGTSIISGTNDAGSVLNAKGATSGTMIFQTDSTERMRLDSSGNLGLGVTPSAWSLGKAIEINNVGNALWGAAASEIDVSQNAYYNTAWRYASSSFASRYEQNTGAHRWYTAPSGTAGDAITFTQAMTLTAAGQLCLGVTTPSGSSRYTIGGLTTSDSGVEIFLGRSGATESATVGQGAALQLQNTTNSTACIIQQYSNNLQFFNYTGAAWTERARITSGGDLLVGTTTTSGAGGITLFNNGSTGFSFVNNNNASATGYVFSSYRRSSIEIGSVTQNGTTAVLFNTTSDRRLKNNIVPAPSASAVIDAIEIVSHDWKSAPDEHVTYGVIAQDLALVTPQAVLQGDDGDEIEKPWGVDYSKLVPMLIKEIQSLRARVAALEAK